MDYNYQDICKQVCELARSVGNFIRQERKKFSADLVEVKGENNFVTYVDKTAEE